MMRPKTDLPYRRRQQAIAVKKTWWDRVWASRTAWVVVGSTVAWVLSNGVNSLSNLRKLPSEIQTTYHLFQSWYYDDTKWTGTWSSRVEGDIEDFQQSDVPLKITIRTKRGKVFGEVFNRRVCDLNPMLPPVLVEGDIRGGMLFAYTYAYVGGKKNFLYSFTAKRSTQEPVITLIPYKDPHQLLPNSARLVESIENQEKSDSAAVTTASVVEHPDLKCPESSVEYIHRMLIQKETAEGEKSVARGRKSFESD